MYILEPILFLSKHNSFNDIIFICESVFPWNVCPVRNKNRYSTFLHVFFLFICTYIYLYLSPQSIYLFISIYLSLLSIYRFIYLFLFFIILVSFCKSMSVCLPACIEGSRYNHPSLIWVSFTVKILKDLGVI